MAPGFAGLRLPSLGFTLRSMGNPEPDTMLGTGAGAQPTPRRHGRESEFGAPYRRRKRLKRTVRTTLTISIVTIGK